jgi:hypothetical protein
MNHDEIEREMLPDMSCRQLLVIMYGGPWPEAADETDAAALIHRVSLMALAALSRLRVPSAGTAPDG